MDAFDLARELYREAKKLVDATRELAADHDELRWAREDLEEDLLDLKLAVMDGNLFELPELIDAVLRMIAIIRRIIDPPDDGTEDS